MVLALFCFMMDMCFGMKDAMLYGRCMLVCVCVCESRIQVLNYFLIGLRLRHNDGRPTLGLDDLECLTPSQECT